MSNDKPGLSYATVAVICSLVGVLCAGLGSAISLRIYAGLPERVEQLEAATSERIAEVKARADKLETRVQVNEDRLSSDMRHIHASLAEIKTMIRYNNQ